ncbi:hypothetical protein ACS3SW_20680 [Roseobacteraceae bacterium S113]
MQSLIYLVRITLFRAYLFLLFAMRMGGAMVLGVAAGGAFLVLEHMETNVLYQLPEYVFTPMQQARDAVLSADILRGIYVPSFEYGYEIVAVMIAVGVFIVLRVATKIISPVVFAFPMPRRPLAPVLRFIPPEHKIHAVRARIAAPMRREAPWSGDWQKITKRLPARLQEMMDTADVQSATQARRMPKARPMAPHSSEGAPAASEPLPARTPSASAPRGRFIPPEGQSAMPS